jgi:hypothetical protein
MLKAKMSRNLEAKTPQQSNSIEVNGLPQTNILKSLFQKGEPTSLEMQDSIIDDSPGILDTTRELNTDRNSQISAKHRGQSQLAMTKNPLIPRLM